MLRLCLKACLILSVLFSSFTDLKCQSLLLTGKLLNGRAGDSVELNVMPFGSKYFKDYSLTSVIDNKGNFQFAINDDKEKFVLVRYFGKEQWFLLSPERRLYITIDTTAQEVFKVSGKGAPENKLLQMLRPKELYFAQDVDWGKGRNPYMLVSEDSMKTKVFPMVMRSLDSALKIISRAAFPEGVQDALETEIRFYYFPQFIRLVWNGWRVRHPHIFGFFNIVDTVFSAFGIPSRAEMEGEIPSAFDYMADCYWSINRLKANFDFGYDRSKGDADEEFQKIYKYDPKENRRALDSMGYVYADALAASQFLPSYAYEKWLTMNIEFWSEGGDLLNASRMQKDLIRCFPHDKYIGRLSQKINALQRLKDKYAANSAIGFRESDRVINSIEELVAPYKGKVVYLDFWGTWCGWCLEEIKTAAPCLREKMKGKDVVFLYVACDNDGDSTKWMNDIYIYNMEGEHVRIRRNDIHILRDALDKGEKEKRASLYPTYYVFDRDGKPAIKNAKRPSDGEALYEQLDSVLNLQGGRR